MPLPMARENPAPGPQVSHPDFGLKKKSSILLWVFYQNREGVAAVACVCKVSCPEVETACMPRSKRAPFISLGLPESNQEHEVFPFLLPFTSRSESESVSTPSEPSGEERRKPHPPLPTTHQPLTPKFSSNLLPNHISVCLMIPKPRSKAICRSVRRLLVLL